MTNNNTRIFTSISNSYAEQARFNERLREVQQLGLNKRLKASNNPRVQIFTERRSNY